MNILLAAATEVEILPTLDWLRVQATASGRNRYALGSTSIAVCLTGVGIMAATEALTRALLSAPFDFAVQAGIAGAFSRALPLGEVVIVESDAPGDLGAEERDGTFLDLHDLGLLGKEDTPFRGGRLWSTRLNTQLGAAFSHLRSASAITVQTVSGTAQTIEARAARWGVDVETMEGAAIHYCCLLAGVPFVQIRAISNYIEPRNRTAWKTAEAVTALNTELIRWLQALPVLE